MTQRPLGRLFLMIMCSLLGLFFLFGSCSLSLPPTLKSTRTRVQELQQDPFIQEYAHEEMAEAERAMRYAELRWEEVQDPEEVSMLTRQTERLLDDTMVIAEERASLQNGAQRARLRFRQPSDSHSSSEGVFNPQKLNIEHSAIGLETRLKDQAKSPDKEIYLSLRSDLLFEHNTDLLNEEIPLSLEPIVSYLATHPEQHIRIEGHTDSTDDMVFNKEFSEARARRIVNFLTERGIARTRIQFQGLGEEYPVASNSTSSGRLRNRRIDLFIFTPKN